MKTVNANLSILKTTALIALIFGAIGSLYFVIQGGKNNNSVLLIALFIAWVLSPFIGLFFSVKIAKQWSLTKQKILNWLMLIIAVVSVVCYSGIIFIGAKPAFKFLIVPFISWVLMLIIILPARKSLRK